MNHQTAEDWLTYIYSTPIEIEELKARVEECRQAIDHAEQNHQWKFVLDLSSKLANKFLYSGFPIQGSEELNLEQDLWGVAYDIFKMGQTARQFGCNAASRDYFKMSLNIRQEFDNQSDMNF